jgi:hypothetical protein
MRATFWIPALLVPLVEFGMTGCGGGDATPTERLWISAVPTSPKTEITAFATMRADGDKYLGAFFRGTLLRGRHDVFEWKDTGKGRASLRFLQDNTTASIRVETCKPTTGFDYCLLVHGDPTGAERYQSRKRWVVRRPGGRKNVGGAFVLDALTELSDDDEDLAAALSQLD